MKKGYLLGGLAVVGTIALFSYLKPKAPRRNSEGFFGANATASGVAYGWCARRNANGSVSYYTNYGGCPKGSVAVKYFGDRTGV